MLKKKILMKKFICLFIIFFSLVSTNLWQNNLMIMKLTYGEVEIELYPEKSTKSCKKI